MTHPSLVEQSVKSDARHCSETLHNNGNGSNKDYGMGVGVNSKGLLTDQEGDDFDYHLDVDMSLRFRHQTRNKVDTDHNRANPLEEDYQINEADSGSKVMAGLGEGVSSTIAMGRVSHDRPHDDISVPLHQSRIITGLRSHHSGSNGTAELMKRSSYMNPKFSSQLNNTGYQSYNRMGITRFVASLKRNM